MSKEKTINAGQVEIVVARGRQSLYPHVITCAESDQAYSDKEVLMMENYIEIRHNFKIKACPFCGSCGELNSYETSSEDVKKVVCCSNEKCPMDLPPYGFYAATKMEAVAIWNERSERDW